MQKISWKLWRGKCKQYFVDWKRVRNRRTEILKIFSERYFIRNPTFSLKYFLDVEHSHVSLNFVTISLQETSFYKDIDKYFGFTPKFFFQNNINIRNSFNESDEYQLLLLHEDIQWEVRRVIHAKDMFRK